jgi:hypothetical protein
MQATAQPKRECHCERGSPRRIEHMAHSIVNGHSHFRRRAEQFEFLFEEEVLVVRGSVPSFYLKQILQTVLRKVDGVRRIDNQVTVISCEGLSSTATIGQAGT